MIRFKLLDSTVHMMVSDASTINGKDGVTPHIGDNGNWYLGDVDTGNPSRGETGPAGYTPVRGTDYWTAADQNAIVSQAVTQIQPDISGIKDDLATKLPKSPANWGPWTAEEQAAARERMGIPGDFELIEEIVLEEDVSVVERTQEPDGTPYNFKKIVVSLTSAKTEYGSRTIYTRCCCGSVYTASFSVFTENLNYYKRSIWRGQIESSELRFSTVDNTHIYGMQGSVSGDTSIYRETPNCIIVGDNITKISTYCNNGLSIPKGFLMQIYGVRAV